jgi:hypothetical protein
MSCRDCRFYIAPPQTHEEWLADKRSYPDRAATEKGTCAYWPTWESVMALHWCGQYQPEAFKDVGKRWQRMHELGDGLRAEREKRRELEQKLKKVRMQLKEKKLYRERA